MCSLRLLLFISCVAFCAAKYADELTVTLANGSPVHGFYKTSHSGHGIRAFTNIPYAEAPVGNLRFADPVPKAPWTSPMKNSQEIIMCPQEEMFFYHGMYMGQEDCLVLNVFAPLNPKREPLPVMFYIHGGGFISGTGNQLLYGPEFLLEEDVILVTGNYRLGALGFMATFTDEFTGNYGMKDQVLMLKWVQENIHNFGGDPTKVTIFGESAGAGSVGYHMMSPMSQGLFNQAILHSGNAFENWANISQAQSLKFTEQLMKSLDCEFTTGDYKAALQCMREKDPKDIVENVKYLRNFGSHPIVTFGPVKEMNSQNPFITDVEYKKPCGGKDIDVIVGVTANEGAFMAAMFSEDPQEMAHFEENFDEKVGEIIFLFDRFESQQEKVKELKQRYFNGQNFSWKLHQKKLVDLFSEICFIPGFGKFIKNRMSVTGTGNTYAYVFNYRGSATFSDMFTKEKEVDVNFGISHVDDLFYIFPMVKNVLNHRIMTDEDHKIRKQMVKLWTHFAINGTPSTKNIKWSPVTKQPIDYLRIGNCNLEACDPATKTMSEMASGFFDEKINYMQGFYNGKSVGKEEL